MDYTRYKTLKVEKEDRIAIITMNRPEALNAVSTESHVELSDVFEDVAKDGEVNVVVLTGAGRAFSAGGDIRGMGARFKDPSLPGTPMEEPIRLIQNMLNVDQPIIAAVNGDAIGLGATMALFCDIIYAAEGARIGDPHVRVGLVAGDGGAVIWPLLIGLPRAKELLLTGDLVTGREAAGMGLINKALPAEQVMPTAIGMAKRLAGGASRAIRFTKRSINKSLRQQVNLILDTSIALEFLTMRDRDHGEAVSAFLEKRAPRFSGK